jgi:hypothetical protein
MSPCSERQKTRRTPVAMIPASLVGFHSTRAPPDVVMDEAAFRLMLDRIVHHTEAEREYAYDHQSQVGSRTRPSTRVQSRDGPSST